jgi:argininosuccinate lyase
VSRFAEPQHDDFRKLNDSLRFDWRLAPYDVAQSRAHANMLAAQGIITEPDRDSLLSGLDQVQRELADGAFPFADGDEDIHMAIERRLTEIVGPVGGRLHTARSRNDQVATDVAMFVRAHASDQALGTARLASTMIDVAEAHLDWPMPGYTHLQRAQPVYLSHHLLAYAWMVLRDRERFGLAAAATRLLPLGAGALAGVNFDTDRRMVAAELGFADVAPNSIDAVSSRDSVLDYLSAAATCATHLSRLGAEIVLWSSEEFGFCEVSDAWASGSSIMPQKKNPDAAELLRAKAPRVVGHLSALHGVLHGLPLTYNKDMQEDKEHLFDAVDTLDLCLAAAIGMLGSIRFDRSRLALAASDEFLAATDVADLLVRRGVPFREAHGVVAGLVRTAVSTGRSLSELRADELASACLRTAPGSSRRCQRAAPASTACATNWRWRGGSCPGREGSLLRAAGAPGRARPDRLRRVGRRVRGRDRRDRGLPRLRAGVPRVRRADAEDQHPVRSAWSGVRVPLVWDPRDAQRRLRTGGRRCRRADPRARARWRCRRDALSPGGGGGFAAVLRSWQADCGPWRLTGPERHGPLSGARRHLRSAARLAGGPDRHGQADRNHEGRRAAVALLRRGQHVSLPPGAQLGLSADGHR